MGIELGMNQQTAVAGQPVSDAIFLQTLRKFLLSGCVARCAESLLVDPDFESRHLKVKVTFLKIGQPWPLFLLMFVFSNILFQYPAGFELRLSV